MLFMYNGVEDEVEWFGKSLHWEKGVWVGG